MFRNYVTEVRNAFGAFVPIRGNRYYPGGDGSDTWSTWNDVGLLKLKRGVSSSQLARPFSKILQKYASKDVQNNLRVVLAPLRGYHIRENNGAIARMITTLSLVALFILLERPGALLASIALFGMILFSFFAKHVIVVIIEVFAIITLFIIKICGCPTC